MIHSEILFVVSLYYHVTFSMQDPRNPICPQWTADSEHDRETWKVLTKPLRKWGIMN